jgi:hypothetical protein
MANNQSLALSTLLSSLKQIGTPSFPGPLHRTLGLTTGQLGSTMTLLTKAFHEQCHNIGWLHFQQG